MGLVTTDVMQTAVAWLVTVVLGSRPREIVGVHHCDFCGHLGSGLTQLCLYHTLQHPKSLTGGVFLLVLEKPPNVHALQNATLWNKGGKLKSTSWTV